MAKQLLTDATKSVDKVNAVAETSRKKAQQMRCRRCNKRGHLEKDCWGSSKNRPDKESKKNSARYDVPKKCYVCQSTGHLQADCPKARQGNRREHSHAKSTSGGDQKKTFPNKSWTPWNNSTTQHRKRKHSGNGADDNSSVDYSAMMRFGQFKPSESAHVDKDEGATAMLDSGTNRFPIKDREYFDDLDENIKRSVQLAKKGATLEVEGVGNVGDFKEVYYCPEADTNLCGVSVVCDMGYTCIFEKDEVLIKDSKTKNIEAKGFRKNGLYYLTMSDFLSLGNTDKVNVSVSHETDRLQVLHERFGHFAHSTIFEGCRNRLFMGENFPGIIMGRSTNSPESVIFAVVSKSLGSPSTNSENPMLRQLKFAYLR
jgi:hypothetical protein